MLRGTTDMVTALYAAQAAFFGALLGPLAYLGASLGLLVISAISGVVMLFAFRWVSNPPAIRRARQQVLAQLLAVRLYRDDLTVVLRAQGALLVGLARYMGTMLVPFAVLLIPFALLFGQLDARYGARALHPGEPAIVTATVDEAQRDWRLTAPAGVAVETVGVRVPSRGEVLWRVRATMPGTHPIAISDGAHRTVAELAVAAEDLGAAPSAARPGLWALFLSPTARLDAAGPVAEITVAYPGMRIPIFGWSTHWLVWFLLISAAVALALRKRAGVEF